MSPDRSRSRAILIGTSHYRDPAIRPLPADTCVSAMAGLLTGELCGWPDGRVTALEELDSPREAALELLPLVRDAEDTLLIYYVGHGMRTRDGELALALTGTSADPEILPDSALLFSRLTDALRGSPARTKLLILDCCYAELGLDSDFLFQSGTSSLADDFPVDGLYFIGASTRLQKAKTPLGGRLTHFTRALIDVVEAGIPGGPPDLHLQQIFVGTRARLLRDGMPQPVDGGVRDAYRYPFARNAAHDADPGTTDAAASPSALAPAVPTAAPHVGPYERLRQPGRRTLLLGGLGVAALGAAGIPLGLSLTRSGGQPSTARHGSGGTEPQAVPYATFSQEGASNAAFSPDGATLAVGSEDGTITLWDIAAKTRRASLVDFTGPSFLGVGSVAFSPDGVYLAGVDQPEVKRHSNGNVSTTIWEVATRRRAATLTDPGVFGVNKAVFSPKGAVLATGNGIGTVSLWSVSGGGAKINTLSNALANEHTTGKEINDVAFSPDGSVLALSTVAGLVELWDVSTGHRLATVPGVETGVGTLAFSPDGKTLVGATDGMQVQVWDVATHKAKGVLSFPRRHGDDGATVDSLAYSPDGKILTAGTLAGMVYFWDVAAQRVTGSLGRFTSYGSADVATALYSPNGRMLAAVLIGEVRLWTIR
ncbi:caspase family protein [Streptomyces monashensis]|uniref:caspase, EACC1-associated type n=1 Tax=Streptomyces monashensis TaxID=1678012 RepID=UPI0033F4B684